MFGRKKRDEDQETEGRKIDERVLDEQILIELDAELDEAGIDVGAEDLQAEDQLNPESALGAAIEAICMVSDQPVPATIMAEVLEVSTSKIDEVCALLAKTYVEQRRGFVLVNVAGGWRFQSHPDQAPNVERFVLDGQTARLSGAALETLAIVAYKQPLSRAQIAAIRGVNVDGVLKTLQQRGYVTELGNDSGPGQALLFGTTSLFLEKLGLASLEDLPPLGDFIPGADLVEILEQGLRPSSVVDLRDDDRVESNSEPESNSDLKSDADNEAQQITSEAESKTQ